MSCLHIFRKQWFAKPHDCSSQIIVQPLTSGFMSSKVNLFWKPSSVSFLSVYIQFCISLILFLCYCGNSQRQVLDFLNTNADISLLWWKIVSGTWLSHPKLCLFFVYGRSFDSCCKELIASVFWRLNQKMGKAPSFTFCFFSSNSVPRIVIWCPTCLNPRKRYSGYFF